MGRQPKTMLNSPDAMQKKARGLSLPELFHDYVAFELVYYLVLANLSKTVQILGQWKWFVANRCAPCWNGGLTPNQHWIHRIWMHWVKTTACWKKLNLHYLVSRFFPIEIQKNFKWPIVTFSPCDCIQILKLIH